MAKETNTSIRLSKVTKEFNIGKDTIVECLSKKGFQVAPSPNAKLTNDMYALLVKEYQCDKEVKNEAKKLGNLSYKGGSVSVVSELQSQTDNMVGKKNEPTSQSLSFRITEKNDAPTPCENKANEKRVRNKSTNSSKKSAILQTNPLIGNKTAMTDSEIKKTVDMIFGTMELINEAYKNKKRKFIFKCAPRWHSIYKGFFKVPHDKDGFTVFVNNISQTYSDWTTHNKKVDGKVIKEHRLTSEFCEKYNRWEFHNTIKGLRNDNIIHGKSDSVHWNYGESLRVIQGSKNPPSTPEDYQRLHSNLLRMYLDEIEFIYEKVREMPD